ncbi:transposase [Rhizobium mongolense]|uniref:transposase n=1 Tax=Rhizobium mongolense TaxID=57676 RepID=UPI00389AFF21
MSPSAREPPGNTGRYHRSVLWSPSYLAASCGGAPLSVIAEYVRSQREAAQGRSRLPPRPERPGIPARFRMIIAPAALPLSRLRHLRSAHGPRHVHCRDFVACIVY